MNMDNLQLTIEIKVIDTLREQFPQDGFFDHVSLGHPDLVLRKYRTCIFVNGCFWHGHLVDMQALENSNCCKIPNTNRYFWVEKIRKNKERDREEQRQLAQMGWHCITVWECELKPQKRETTLDSIAFTLNHIWLQDHGARSIPYPKVEEEDMQMSMASERENE
jgi:DNA mismatch endonuclease (patch repair protein)